MCKINCTDNLFRQSRPLLNYIVGTVQNKQSTDAAVVEWFNTHTNPINDVCNSNELKQNDSTKSNENISTSDSNGLPNVEQLDHVYNRLGEDVSNQTYYVILKIVNQTRLWMKYILMEQIV